MMINIAELLKDCPEGTKLYSPLFGDVKLRCAHLKGTSYPIVVKAKDDDTLMFDEYGRYFDSFKFPDAECLLFPSKDCRTWERWKLPVEPKFKVGDWIVRGEGFVYEPSLITEIRDYYICELLNGERVTYTLNDVHKNFHLWTLADAKDGDVLAVDWHQDDDSWEKIVIFKKYHAKGVKGLLNSPCVEGYGNTFKNRKLVLQEEVPYYSKTWTMTLQPATKEQRDLLFAKMKEKGCQWDADKKEPRKINLHYDIANLHAGMPVLVRDYDNTQWRYVQFSHCVGKDNPIMFNACGNTWEQCIPYNDDTKHLLGTTDMPSEEYINW